MTKQSLFLILLSLFLSMSCKFSTSTTSSDKKIGDYTNQYKMVFESDNNIFSINSDGTGLSRITDFNCYMQNVVVNDDYSKIAFASTLDGYPQNIYIMNMDGSELLKLSTHSSDNGNLSPKFLPSENILIYSCDGRLHRVNYDGSENRQITPDSISIPSDGYSVSRDKIIFHADIIRGNSTIPGLYIIDVNGFIINRFVDGVDYYNPVLSPDGTKICYWSSDDNNLEIFVMNINGSDKLNLSDDSSRDMYAGWSPDGKKIHFESDRDGKNHLYTINPDGSEFKKITTEPADYHFFPTWSPDLTRMAFAAMTGGEFTRDTIFIIDIESGATMKLSDGITSPVWLNLSTQ